MRRIFVLLWLSILATAVIGLFWYNEWIYSLPTQVPVSYKSVLPGEIVDVHRTRRTKENPLFLHFFNPDCPCSKFNMPHFKSLVTQYIDRVDFAVVVLTKKVYTEKEIQKKIGLKIPIWFDSSLATACGVYSTPQAVIIEPGNKLYYRGNYNRNRYCTDIKSNYAQQALETFLYKKNQIQFSQLALKAYGCPLPNCTQQ